MKIVGEMNLRLGLSRERKRQEKAGEEGGDRFDETGIAVDIARQVRRFIEDVIERQGPVPVQVTAEPVNLARLKLLAGTDVTPETLHAAGLISRADTAVKLLGSGDADRAYAVKGMPVSASAKAKIEAAGGRIEA